MKNQLAKKSLMVFLLLALLLNKAWSQRLTGAGATFPFPVYSKWFIEYSSAHPGVKIRYEAIGSGEGIRRVTVGLVDFGASDAPLTDYQLAAARIKVTEIPALIGAVVPIFNLPGVENLRLSGDVLAAIYLGKISKWSDPRIVQDNPGVPLPDQKIIVVHRSETSGTSYIFTDFLSKVSRDWARGPGMSTSPSWPTGSGAIGNLGVARLVGRLPGALGYVEMAYALQNGITFGEVRNPAGHWIKASIASIGEAAAGIKEHTPEFRVSIVNAPGDNAYPISSFSWFLVPNHSLGVAKSKLIRDLLDWILTSGQSEASALAYAPLPKPVVAEVLRTVSSLR
jgi:phosphate transport system substrate-binding protein